MTTNPDLPTTSDQENPLLAPDDPRVTDINYRYEQGEKTPITLTCPLCGEEVQTTYVSHGEEPCEKHPGEVHEQILIDARPMNAHEDVCLLWKLLDAVFPDVRQDDDTPDQNPA